jgi:cytoplasmic iron level regulating protein YaaA (DUF328/UPF0246 family)
MLILLSSSKTMDFDSPLPASAASQPWTQPALLAKANAIARRLRALDAPALGALLGVSDALRDLNHRRYQAFTEGPATPNASATNARPAIFAYTGDSYRDLGLASMTADDFAFAQAHLRTLSGLYGALRPLDIIQPYRLEMSAPLATDDAPDLARAWRPTLTAHLNALLDAADVPLIIHLASNEYFKALDPEDLEGVVVRPTFQDWKDGAFKTIGLFAKRARGAMAAWIIREHVQNLDDLRAFSWDGYAFNPDLSTDDALTFTRGQ